MTRSAFSFTVDDPGHFRRQCLQWAAQFTEVACLEGNGYPSRNEVWDAVIAIDALTSLVTRHGGAFDALSGYQQTTNDWLFGVLSYDLKNELELLSSDNHDGLGFPDLFFFQPKRLFFLKGNVVTLHYLPVCDDEMQHDIEAILQTAIPEETTTGASVQQRIPREAYLEKVKALQGHIHRGDIYEVNFCMEFFAEDADLDPVPAFEKLNAISAPPFAAFVKKGQHFLLSASPERYVAKTGNTVISQPIKGTARRSSDPGEDARIKEALASSPKERSENIMIVDLVRNDLSHTAAKGSVQVTELCGIHTFPQVHQMISTITSELAEGVAPVDVLRATFPMGSMTGAPKIRAMELIEHYEETRRGWYSGSVGYFTPQGDFDCNVVIRSILYDAQRKYVSFSAGGAITAASVPENEYDECLLKAGAMRRVLEGR